MANMKRKQALRQRKTIPVCSHDDLVRSFGKKRRELNTDIQPGSSSNDKNKCWSLEEEILRIPVSAIVNRNDMKRLGHGYKGGVHRALVALQQNADAYRHCYAALKTDHCHLVGFHHFQELFYNDRTSISCVQDNSFLWNDASYLGGEYTGALAFYEAQRHNLVLEGLLPTWAVVTADVTRGALWSRFPRSWLKGAPHSDPSILGVVMPLEDFEPLSRVRHGSYNNPQHVADLMLPVARGLQFIHSLGFATQDMLASNIGIIRDSNSSLSVAKYRSMLYDNTYLSLLGNCTSNQYCDYCPEASLSRAIYPQHRHCPNPIQSDAMALAQIVSGLARGYSSSNQKFRTSLQNCTSASQLVRVLMEHASSGGGGTTQSLGLFCLLPILHPLVYFPMHMVLLYPVAKVNFLKSNVKIALATILWVLQYLLEHYSNEFPLVVKCGPIVQFLCFCLLVGFWYNAYQRSPNKNTALACLGMNVVYTVVIRSQNLGFPLNDAEKQMQALKDPTFHNLHTFMHLVYASLYWTAYMTLKDDAIIKKTTTKEA